jgi:CRISPR-associated protein Cmr4
MSKLRIGYLYSLSPIHCGGEGDLGNILEIAREVHTNFPYLPASSLRGSVRDEVMNAEPNGKAIADRLFGKELDDQGQMGVHQVWFGDARLLWVPMRTMAIKGSGRDVFTWVSCHSLIRDHALLSHRNFATFPDHAVGNNAGTYLVADAEIIVQGMDDKQKNAVSLSGDWSENLKGSVQSTWDKNRIILPDDDFQVLMEHSLWTQVRNKIDASGSAEVFWTDVCIPRDTIFYYPWGHTPLEKDTLRKHDWDVLAGVINGLIQVGGQANVGRGWVQSWTINSDIPSIKADAENLEKVEV